MIGGFDERAVLRRLNVRWVEAPGGSRLEFRCPSHDDSDPSAHLSIRGSRAGLWRCRSCHAGGDLVTLVCAALKLGSARDAGPFKAALAWLRDEAGIRRDPPRAVRVVVGSPFAPSFRLPAEAYFLPLPAWPSGARSYVEGRGVTAAQVAAHRIGFVVDGWLAGRVLVPVLAADGSYAVNLVARHAPP